MTAKLLSAEQMKSVMRIYYEGCNTADVAKMLS